MPTAKAPTLGRNRSSVRIATREAAVDLAEHVVASRPGRRRSGACRSRAGRACRGARRVRPAASPGNRERRDAAGAGARGGAGEHGVDVGIGRVGDPGLVAVQRPAVAVRPRLERERRRRPSPRRARTARTPATTSPLATPGIQRSTRRRRSRTGGSGSAEPLQGERGLGLGVDRGERLAEQAQLHGGRVARGLLRRSPEQPAQQPGPAQRFDQGPVDRAVHGLDAREAGRHRPHPRGVLLLRGGQPERRSRASTGRQARIRSRRRAYRRPYCALTTLVKKRNMLRTLIQSRSEGRCGSR